MHYFLQFFFPFSSPIHGSQFRDKETDFRGMNRDCLFALHNHPYVHYIMVQQRMSGLVRNTMMYVCNPDAKP